MAEQTFTIDDSDFANKCTGTIADFLIKTLIDVL